MTTLKIDNLDNNPSELFEELNDDEEAAVRGGFWFLGGCTFVKPLPLEEACVDWICVPYQDED